jgi:hypothetical protein
MLKNQFGGEARMEGLTVSGRWTGTYAYDPMPGLGDVPTIGFVLEVGTEQGGRFRGTVQDDPAAGMPEVGTVEGHASNGRVEFVKRMPVLYLFEAGRVRHVAECVREWWGLELDGLVPAPPIFYEGGFGAAGQELAGRWWLDKVTVPIPSGGERYALDLGTASGRWTARRAVG